MMAQDLSLSCRGHRADCGDFNPWVCHPDPQAIIKRYNISLTKV
jgi:hypothetical protein